MALKVFTSARAALETTARGTTTTPTRIIYAEEFTHEQEVATIRPAELRNSYSGYFSASPGPETNRLRMSGRLSYDDAAWFGLLFVTGGVTATGGGDPYTWAFLPTLDADDLESAEIQLGYADTIATIPGVKLNYCVGDTLNLHFEKNDDGAVTFDAGFIAPLAATQITAFTGTLSDRSVTLASTNNTTTYSDPGAGTMGATEDPLIIAVDWTLNNGFVPFFTLDGTTAAHAVYRPNHRVWTASITRQFGSDAPWDDFIDKTVQKIRVKTTSAAGRVITLDLYGVFTARSWSEVDGIITEELTLEPIYNVSTTSDFSLTVINGIAAIT
ncbi:MAG TPA: hypothetical protein VM285_00135 [Polyangia bacterium]|nr:hypothetical protein [Polyangia bacterium]HUW16923.1 hypothetical protein [Actinomycetes bacterium]